MYRVWLAAADILLHLTGSAVTTNYLKRQQYLICNTFVHRCMNILSCQELSTCKFVLHRRKLRIDMPWYTPVALLQGHEIQCRHFTELLCYFDLHAWLQRCSKVKGTSTFIISWNFQIYGTRKKYICSLHTVRFKTLSSLTYVLG